jgi:hypothetical protein
VVTTKAKIAAVPAGLSAVARRWWVLLQEEYEITDVAGRLQLEQALRCFDRAEQARRVLDKEGVVTLDARGRPKQHPAFAVERDARSLMLALLKSLNLDLEPLRDRPGRPPGR